KVAKQLGVSSPSKKNKWIKTGNLRDFRVLIHFLSGFCHSPFFGGFVELRRATRLRVRHPDRRTASPHTVQAALHTPLIAPGSGSCFAPRAPQANGAAYKLSRPLHG
ncbi:MAG: hypothetical protein LKJ69_08020, partial [Lactobacillus sp.]|nr:hypothetical protein [Lactobacillus sp.]